LVRAACEACFQVRLGGDSFRFLSIVLFEAVEAVFPLTAGPESGSWRTSAALRRYARAESEAPKRESPGIGKEGHLLPADFDEPSGSGY
jgi:hypothetical protein